MFRIPAGEGTSKSSRSEEARERPEVIVPSVIGSVILAGLLTVCGILAIKRKRSVFLS